jgi:DNA-binding response OmpR family regulator
VACDAKGGEPSLVALLSAAREALAAGRERGDEVRAWDSGDADAAPDVVVVEDDVPLADLIVFALETKGLTHRHYPDGASALEGLRRMRIRGHRPIVLLDVDLPGLDGHSLHERLRVERPGQYDVVFLSVRGAEADQLRALQAGALDYLSKPVSLRVLLAKLASWRARGGTTA